VGDRKQKEHEFEIDQLKERARLEYAEMEKLRKDNELLKRLVEEERLKWKGKWSQEETEIINEVTEKLKEVTETCRARHV